MPTCRIWNSPLRTASCICSRPETARETAAAALKIAVDLVDEGKISEDTAVLRVEPKQLDALLHPQFDAKALKAAKAIGKGLAASPGAACGKVVFTAEDAKAWHENGEKVVLVRLGDLS